VVNTVSSQSAGGVAPSGAGPAAVGRRLLPPRLAAWLVRPWLALAVFAVLACTSMARKSATYDEPILLVSGARFLRTFDPALNAENPPLLKALFALPTLAAEHYRTAVDIDAGLRYSYSMGDEFEFANQVLFSDPAHRRMLFCCRLLSVALAACLGLALYAVCRARWSAAVAVGVLWLYALCPNVLAHAQLLTPDLGCAFFVFLTAVCLYQLLATARWRWAVLLGLALGGALLTKFTAVLLLPCIVLQTALVLALGPRQPWRRLLPGFVVAGVVALTLLNAAYGGRGTPTVLAGARYHSPLVQRLQALPGLSRLPLPVPEAYVRGFDIVAFNNQPGFPNIFLGKLYPQGGRWWFYYLVALATKTPIPFLALVFTGLALCVRRGRAGAAELAFFAVIPVVFLLIFSLVAYRQLGLRYILPLWPFFLLSAGVAIAAALRLWPTLRSVPTAGRRLGLVAAAWYALSCLLIYPDFLSYYNEWAGGPKRGWRILVESNLDWGQDLPALAAWQRRHHDPAMFVLYYGSAPPAAYGVQVQPWGTLPPPPFIAISATNLFMAQEAPLVRYLRDRCEPLDYAGRSILIYAITAGVIQGVVGSPPEGPGATP
jgi:hypothetical protein